MCTGDTVVIKAAELTLSLLWKVCVTHNMRELRAVWIVDSQILNSTPQLVHALHVPSQPTTRTGKITHVYSPG